MPGLLCGWVFEGVLSADEKSGMCQFYNALGFEYACTSTVEGHTCKHCERYAL